MHNGCGNAVRNLYHWERRPCAVALAIAVKDSFASVDIFCCCSGRCWCTFVRVSEIGMLLLLLFGAHRLPHTLTNDKLNITICSKPFTCIQNIPVQCAHRIIPFLFFKQKNIWWNALIRNKSSKKSFTFSFPCIDVFIFFFSLCELTPSSSSSLSLPGCVCVLFLFYILRLIRKSEMSKFILYMLNCTNQE